MRNLLELAHANRHRGSKHGVGVIDVANTKSLKTIVSIEELMKNDLKGKWWKRKYKVVSEAKKELSGMNELLSEKSTFSVLHHRMASVGKISFENTHPFKISNNLLFLHNGSVKCESLRGLIQESFGVKLKSQTDSEVLGNVSNLYFLGALRRNKNSNLLRSLKNTFGNVGVGMTINVAAKAIHIFKDESRDLFMLKKGDQTFLISEPTKEFGKVDSCYYLKECSDFRIPDFNMKDCVYEDVTKRFNEFVEKKTYYEYCDVCEETKQTSKIDGDDICMGCYVQDLENTKKRELVVPTNIWDFKEVSKE